MKTYNVRFERFGRIFSDFQIKADNLKDAKLIALRHKRQGFSRCKTIVYLSK